MHTQSFLAHSSEASESLGLERSLTLHSQPEGDTASQRTPVKILVIGSREAVTTTVYTLHHLRFAEIFEWTDFLAAPPAHQGFHLRPDEVMKALVKYLPHG
ncbi:MAG: hypothetical protein WBA57_05655 [Elainellaceae cyanobacterium]